MNDYDAKAEEYAKEYADILEHTPLDRQLLDLFAQRLEGSVLDLACGPGHVAGYLREKGLAVLGLDLSSRMVELAREQFPEAEFAVGDMLQLPVSSQECGGITAFYAIVHLSAAHLGRAIMEMYRALRPGGQLLLTFHSQLLDGQPDYRIFPLAEVKAALLLAGFAIEVEMERMPVADEDRTRRALIWAFKAA